MRVLTFDLQGHEISRFFGHFLKRVKVTDCTGFDPVVIPIKFMDCFFVNMAFLVSKCFVFSE